ncbi:DegT/DnrJ/EryC1/StrS family aminotransferase [Mucilaginibacter jinjuensis]|uniref:DegT/DnrJ/EryC1/StrS family aminotransferase n=1 Tax=Mucilaginibacter jinjuensis TaxID=1176721 RepID=A0ABY7T4C9_9SPHI|nr:DegT/DnrJ/EryC1/StrS family aminotransferase [Mucilaginibacter jinjuensis]WCT10611.1 DegT/DnrJ/EryC1/StrS family aminotransferase [Mucilaginibacter jinjuensis]
MDKKIPINKPSITALEISYVNDAVTNGWGEKCYDYIYKFQNDFARYQDSKFALATSSCTGAIHLALMALGVKANDEVIVPDITWIASVEPVLYIGAKPVFVDVLADTWCIDPVKIEEAITPNTKAIIVVHLYGNLCDMDAIMDIAKRHNLVVIEDAAEGLGSEYKGRKAGSIGDAGVFSFHGTKTMTTGEGGIMVTNREDAFEKAKVLNDHGRNPKDPENKMFWMRDYGYKYKMSNLQAALGCAQMERMEELVAKKREIFNWYRQLLVNIPGTLNPELAGTKNSYWLPTVVFNKNINFDRDAFFDLMKKNGIDSRPFFFPLTSLPMFDEKKENVVAYDIYDRAVNLPSFHDLTYQEAEKICSLINSFING